MLTQENKDVFLEVFSQEKGLIYLFNSPLQSTYNNFSKHALVNFVDATLGDARSDLVQFSKDLKHPSMIRDARKRFKKNEKKEALAVLEFFSKNSLSKA